MQFLHDRVGKVGPVVLSLLSVERTGLGDGRARPLAPSQSGERFPRAQAWGILLAARSLTSEE